MDADLNDLSESEETDTDPQENTAEAEQRILFDQFCDEWLDLENLDKHI